MLAASLAVAGLRVFAEDGGMIIEDEGIGSALEGMGPAPGAAPSPAPSSPPPAPPSGYTQEQVDQQRGRLNELQAQQDEIRQLQEGLTQGDAKAQQLQQELDQLQRDRQATEQRRQEQNSFWNQAGSVVNVLVDEAVGDGRAKYDEVADRTWTEGMDALDEYNMDRTREELDGLQQRQADRESRLGALDAQFDGQELRDLQHIDATVAAGQTRSALQSQLDGEIRMRDDAANHPDREDPQGHQWLQDQRSRRIEELRDRIHRGDYAAEEDGGDSLSALRDGEVQSEPVGDADVSSSALGDLVGGIHSDARANVQGGLAAMGGQLTVQSATTRGDVDALTADLNLDQTRRQDAEDQRVRTVKGASDQRAGATAQVIGNALVGSVANAAGSAATVIGAAGAQAVNQNAFGSPCAPPVGTQPTPSAGPGVTTSGGTPASSGHNESDHHGGTGAADTPEQKPPQAGEPPNLQPTRQVLMYCPVHKKWIMVDAGRPAFCPESGVRLTKGP